MGFFSNYNAIGRINALIKQLEPKLDYIAGELQYPYSINKERLRVECGTVSVLMSEIADIIQSSGRSVFLAPYYFKGRKMTIMDLHGIAASLVQQAEELL
ncbi:hypothetical protein I6E11_13930 [Bacteroides caecigallinarum]|uniref:hypothetical protein n=1 Tax=Bacteroides caecigallinarum TaxID=1411144 RepID=UPI001F48FF40|nr:hypothetical protein [Bacteroides caecigallinarum]MCF2594868.1 hypothetical protein [Bacteroides caecigallinarum]MCF2738836.1 hypothetical protein [Bacteroides caecigallinarum]